MLCVFSEWLYYTSNLSLSNIATGGWGLAAWPPKEAKSYEELAEVGRLAQARLQDWLREFKSEAHLAEEQLSVFWQGGANDYTPEITKVRIHWRMPLKIHNISEVLISGVRYFCP